MAKPKAKHLKARSKKSPWLIIVIVVGLLLVGGALYYFLVYTAKPAPTLDEMSLDITAAENDNDVTTAVKRYDALIEKADSDERKAELLLDRGWTLFYKENNAYLDQALADAREAERLTNNASAIALIRDIAEWKNDTALFKEYQKKYQSSVDQSKLPGGPAE